jgi:hypothetical protein
VALKTFDEYTSSYPQCPEVIDTGRISILTEAGLDSMNKETKPIFLQYHELLGCTLRLYTFACRLSWRALQREILQIV